MSEKRAPRSGRPKSEQKTIAIMTAGTDLFLAQGFQGTSMDAVAQRAGVSKQTVYSHFATKEELFAACVRAKVTGYGFDEIAEVPDGDLRSALLTVARRLVGLLSDPEVVAAHRVVISEAISQPHIAALFFKIGPQRTIASLCTYLGRQVENGRLRIPEEDLEYAAAQLVQSAFGMYKFKLWLGILDKIPEKELSRHLEHVIDDFLRLYGTGS